MINAFHMNPDELKRRAQAVRRAILTMNCRAGQGHTGADLSEADILTALFFRVLRYDPADPAAPDRDRFILSKGHGVGGFYCVLAEAGMIDPASLETYLQFESGLPGHPVRQKTPGVEVNTGGLGHGLSVGAGLALAAKRRGRPYRVYVLTGDGELQEGSNWEAAMSAARFGLDNLVVIVDRNRLQLADRTENIMPIRPLPEKWRTFGFDVNLTDGHDMAALTDTLENLDFDCGRPHVVVASTVKGKGVSFIEDNPAWHHKIPVGDELPCALKELE